MGGCFPNAASSKRHQETLGRCLAPVIPLLIAGIPDDLGWPRSFLFTWLDQRCRVVVGTS